MVWSKLIVASVVPGRSPAVADYDAPPRRPRASVEPRHLDVRDGARRRDIPLRDGPGWAHGAQTGAHLSSAAVGRAVESRRLRAAVDAACRGGSVVVVLVGEGGVGKTRLLSEAAGAARAAGAAVLVGRAAIATPLPFGVIAEALRSWQRDHPAKVRSTPFDRGLRLVLPEWSDAGAEPELSEPQLRLLAFEGVVDRVRDVARESGGAVVVLDDLHAADPESIETARHLGTAAIAGVALLIGMRPGEGGAADELVRCLRRDGVADVLEVEPLDAVAVAELVEALISAPPTPEFVEDIMARTDGVPILVEEVVAAHLRAGSVRVAEGVMVWPGDAVAVPRTVREMVASRLDRLESSHREVICAGAVLGDFAPDVLAGVSGVRDVDEAIAGGARVSLLDATGPVAFRHAIIREAVLESIGPQALAELHRRSAAALAQEGSDDAQALERRAVHHEALGDGDEAARLWTEASRARLRTHALLRAEELARAALQRALESVRRVAAADALAETLVAQGRWTDAREIDNATSAVYGETPARRHRVALAELESGRPDRAAEVTARAFALGDAALPLYVVDGRAALVRGDADRALACARHVLDGKDADIEVRLAALDLTGRAHDFAGRRDDAERTWLLLANQAAMHGRTQAQLRAVVQLGKVELFAGKPAERLREAVDLARAAGAFVELAWAEENLAVGLLLRGEVDEAEQIVVEAIERCRRLRLDQVAYLLAVRGMVETFRGGDAEKWLDEAEALLPTDDLRLHTYSGRADIAMREGRYADAVRWFADCRDIMARMPGIVPMDAPCYLVWALAAAGRADEARQVLAEVRQLPDLQRWYTRPALLDAAEALLDGDPARVDAIVAGGAFTPMDIGLLRLVGADVVSGDARVRWLLEALDCYDGMGMAGTAKRVRRLLRDAGSPVPRRRRAASQVPEELATRGVTSREAEVLRLVAEGRSNAEIAGELVLSVRTVEAHVSSLLSKLNADRRSQLVSLRVEP